MKTSSGSIVTSVSLFLSSLLSSLISLSEDLNLILNDLTDLRKELTIDILFTFFSDFQINSLTSSSLKSLKVISNHISFETFQSVLNIFKIIILHVNSIFIFCDHFLNASLFAVKWLIKLNYELKIYEVNEIISFKKYLKFINLLLINEIIEWVEFNLNVITILFNSALN